MNTELDYDYWSKCDTIEAWEAAYLMRGYDPRLADSIMERDPHDPQSVHGAPPDLSDELRFLRSAAQAGTLTATDSAAADSERAAITRVSLIPWLESRGYDALANGLRGSGGPSTPATGGSSAPSSAPIQRPMPRTRWRQETILNEIRGLGYDPKALPKGKAGLAGVKKEVHDKLLPSQDWPGKTFANTWQALRGLNEIVDDK